MRFFLSPWELQVGRIMGSKGVKSLNSLPPSKSLNLVRFPLAYLWEREHTDVTVGWLPIKMTMHFDFCCDNLVMQSSLWLCICTAEPFKRLLRDGLMGGRQKCWILQSCQVPALWTGGLFFHAAIWKWSRICFMFRCCLNDYSDEDTFGMQKVSKHYNPNPWSLQRIWVRLGMHYSYTRRGVRI